MTADRRSGDIGERWGEASADCLSLAYDRTASAALPCHHPVCGCCVTRNAPARRGRLGCRGSPVLAQRARWGHHERVGTYGSRAGAVSLMRRAHVSVVVVIPVVFGLAACSGVDRRAAPVEVSAHADSSIVVTVSPSEARAGDEVAVAIRNDVARAVVVSSFLALRDSAGTVRFYLSTVDPNDSIEVSPGEKSPIPTSGGPLPSGATSDRAVVVPDVAAGDYTLAPMTGNSDREIVVAPGTVTVVG